jgi:hypothetical protein
MYAVGANGEREINVIVDDEYSPMPLAHGQQGGGFASLSCRGLGFPSVLHHHGATP